MEINVMGQGEKKFKPDQIVLNIDISNVYSNYEVALVKGEESVLDFLNQMEQFGFKFEDFKTAYYQIKDEFEYRNNISKKIGVRYSRSLKLTFDFDIEKMSKMVETTSKMKNSPKINVRYGLKDIKCAEMELFTDAYQNAQRQADIIANAAGLKVVKCVKTNIREACDSYYSRTCYETGRMYKGSEKKASELIAKTYIPEDIEVEQEIFCVFIAE